MISKFPIADPFKVLDMLIIADRKCENIVDGPKRVAQFVHFGLVSANMDEITLLLFIHLYDFINAQKQGLHTAQKE